MGNSICINSSSSFINKPSTFTRVSEMMDIPEKQVNRQSFNTQEQEMHSPSLGSGNTHSFHMNRKYTFLSQEREKQRMETTVDAIGHNTVPCGHYTLDQRRN